ncbi:MAG TPA: Gfo/Idh/MocA family oxidoreductase [Candidatus Acidoferrum sp.]|nr:Gfo/Idh/MocA family oxidoreductase [Candidatus Acidoferrum sp.]
MQDASSHQKAVRLNRRRFLKTAGAAAVLPLILPGCATGPSRRTAPSNRITIGVVGWGMQGPSNTKAFLYEDDCQVVAACDLDKNHLQDAVDTINDHYDNKDCKAYQDYRELMARTDIDAVMLAVPDHWHELVATEAARRKKDIYGEKPLAKTIAEQQAIVRAVQENKIIWQTGSWQRSQAPFHKAAEIVRNGLIGKVTHVEVGLPSGHHDFAGTAPELLKKLGQPEDKTDFLATVVPGTDAWNAAVTEPPAELDYDFWIGPSQMEPYIKQRIHMDWRWNYNTGGGQLLDWIGHHCDIAHWGLGFDNSGPSEVEGKGDFPPANAIWNTCGKYRIELQYPEDITMTIAGGHPDIKMGTKWIGTEGWVWVNRGGFEGSNPDWKKHKNLADKYRKVKLYESRNHQRNFLDCVKSRQPTIAPVETAHHSAIPGHLGLISMLVGRKIRWNVADEVIVDDPDASKLLTRDYRAPWVMG